MSHADVVAAIELGGGSLRASFELDEHGRTVGDNMRERIHHCAECGERGHNALRCNGEGQPPKPTYSERRTAERVRSLARRANYDLDEARAELQRRIEARRKR